MAVVDSDYCFISTYIGPVILESFEKSKFGRKLHADVLNISHDQPLPGDESGTIWKEKLESSKKDSQLPPY